jgi:hypothetical protein
VAETHGPRDSGISLPLLVSAQMHRARFLRKFAPSLSLSLSHFLSVYSENVPVSSQQRRRRRRKKKKLPFSLRIELDLVF